MNRSRSLERALFRAAGEPGWRWASRADPGGGVEMSMEAGGERVEIGPRHAIVCLAPLYLVLGRPAGRPGPETWPRRFSLTVRENGDGAARAGDAKPGGVEPGGRRLGRLRVCRCPAPALERRGIALAEVLGARCAYLSAARRWRLYVHELYRYASRPGAAVRMRPSRSLALFLLYCLPRPVVLVGYGDGPGACAPGAPGNLVPMDLVGELGDGWLALGLHASSPALPMIAASRRLAVAGLPARFHRHAVAAGRHHRSATVPWEEIPFPLARSRRFGLPVPRDATSVRELELVEALELGSHHLLLARVVEREGNPTAPAPCQVHSSYLDGLVRRGGPLPTLVDEPEDEAGEDPPRGTGGRQR